MLGNAYQSNLASSTTPISSWKTIYIYIPSLLIRGDLIQFNMVLSLSGCLVCSRIQKNKHPSKSQDFRNDPWFWMFQLPSIKYQTPSRKQFSRHIQKPQWLLVKVIVCTKQTLQLQATHKTRSIFSSYWTPDDKVLKKMYSNVFLRIFSLMEKNLRKINLLLNSQQLQKPNWSPQGCFFTNFIPKNPNLLQIF